MIPLLKNILQGPATTFAAAISAGLAVLIASDSQFLTDGQTAALLAINAFISLFAGPNKLNK